MPGARSPALGLEFESEVEKEKLTMRRARRMKRKTEGALAGSARDRSD